MFYSLFPREGQIHLPIQRIRSLFFLILVKGIVNAVVGRLAEKKNSRLSIEFPTFLEFPAFLPFKFLLFYHI